MNKIDILLINELQKNADTTIHELAKLLNIRRSTIYNRIKKLKQQGVIKRYQAIIDQTKAGLPLCTFILARIRKSGNMEEVCKELSKEPNVEEIHPITGSFDLVIKARFKDINDLSAFTLKKLSKPTLANKIQRTETLMSLGTYKEYFQNV